MDILIDPISHMFQRKRSKQDGPEIALPFFIENKCVKRLRVPSVPVPRKREYPVTHRVVPGLHDTAPGPHNPQKKRSSRSRISVPISRLGGAAVFLSPFLSSNPPD